MFFFFFSSNIDTDFKCQVYVADIKEINEYAYCKGKKGTQILEFDIPISDRRKYNSLMNGIYLYWFQNPKNIHENIFDKICSSLVSEKKVPSMFIPFWGTRLLLRLKINGLIVWMLWMRWNGMIFIMPTSSAPSKPSWGLFTLNFFIRQSALTNFSTELVELILPIVTFVVIHQKLFYTYFVNVKKFPPLGWIMFFD